MSRELQAWITVTTDSTTCAVGQFECSPGVCISKVWRCDGQLDCTDGSDESNCSKCVWWYTLTDPCLFVCRPTPQVWRNAAQRSSHAEARLESAYPSHGCAMTTQTVRMDRTRRRAVSYIKEIDEVAWSSDFFLAWFLYCMCFCMFVFLLLDL